MQVHQGSIIADEMQADMGATAAATASKASGPEWDAPRPVSKARWAKMKRGERAVQLWLQERGRPNMVPVEGSTDA